MSPPAFTPASIGTVYDGFRYIAPGTWQRVTPDTAAPVPAPTTGSQDNCPSGMVHVEGQMIRGITTEMQDRRCTRWLPGEPRRCAQFDETRLRADYARLPNRRAMNFCMDRYEYPNVPGEYPAIGMSYNQALTMCRDRGREVCTDREFMFACEGPEGHPYATGFTRAEAECPIDRRWTNPAPFRARRASDANAATALSTGIYNAARSGEFPACVSWAGVADQTGNADENVTSEVYRRGHFRNVQMGGHWAGVRNRCEPATTAHNEGYRDYQLSFRCCAPYPEQPMSMDPTAPQLTLAPPPVPAARSRP